MSACICIGPTTGDHLCPCRRRDEDARQAAKAQGVFSEWNACCYRDECRRRATDYAALQAKLDAVTKDAERYRFLRDEEAHRPFGRYPVIVGRFGEELDTAIDAAMQQRTALTDQGRAGEVDRG